MPAVWSIQLMDSPHVASGGVKGSLTTARSRAVTQGSADDSTCSWTMSYYTPGTRTVSAEVQMLTPRSTDVIVYRDSVVMFRGRLSMHQVIGSTDGEITVACSAMSYKSMLKRRFLLDADCQKLVDANGNSFISRRYSPTADVGAVVWDLIKTTQSMANGTLGITASTDGITGGAPTAMTAVATPGTSMPEGLAGNLWSGGNGNTGITSSTGAPEFPVATSIYDCIDTLAQGNAATTDFGAGPVNSAGFDWDVIPDPVTGSLSLHVWPLSRAAPHSPGRGEVTGYLLDYGGTVASFTNDYDIGADTSFANLVRVSAGQAATARQLGAGTAADGLWEGLVTIPVAVPSAVSGNSLGPVLQQTVDKLAADTYLLSNRVSQAYSLVLRPSAWNGDTQLGDTIVVSVPNLENQLGDSQRILTQTFAIGDDGEEVVTLAVGALPMFTADAAAKRQKAANAAFRKYQRSLFGSSR